MPIFALILLFFFLELFLILMAAIEHGWSVFWFEVATAIAGALLLSYNREVAMRDLFGQGAGVRRLDLVLLKNASITLGATLLIMPGFITDALGIAILLIPASRSFLLGILKFASPPKIERPKSKQHGNVIDGEVERPDQHSDR